MDSFVTQNNSLSSGVTFNTSEIKIGLGNKLLVDAGAVNTIVLGAWNRLMACATTEVQLGSAAEITVANASSVTWGKSYNYANEYQTIARNSDTRAAINQLLLAGGLSLEERQRRRNEREKAYQVLFLTITSFTLMLGLSLLSIQISPFETTINEDGDLGTQLKPGAAGIGVILGETFGTLMIFIGQLLIARIYAKDNNDINNIKAISNLSLSANGISSTVYSQLDAELTSWPSNNNEANTQSPAARFNMHPGNNGDISLCVSNHQQSSSMCMPRDLISVVAKHETRTHSINANAGDIIRFQNTQDNIGGCIEIKGQKINISRNDGNPILLEYQAVRDNTLLPPVPSDDESLSDMEPTIAPLEEDLESENDGMSKRISIKLAKANKQRSIDIEGSSCLDVSSDRISISTDNYTNGIFLIDNDIYIQTQNKIIGSFSQQKVSIGKRCSITETGMILGDLYFKTRSHSSIQTIAQLTLSDSDSD